MTTEHTATDEPGLPRRQDEARRQSDEFTGMIAHELRNSLSPIRNAAYLLHLIDLKNPRPQQMAMILDMAGMIERQVSHMAKLIDNLLDGTPPLHPTDAPKDR